MTRIEHGVDVSNCRWVNRNPKQGDKDCKSPEEYNNCSENPNCKFKMFEYNKRFKKKLNLIKQAIIQLLAITSGTDPQKLLNTPDEQLTREGLAIKQILSICEDQ